MNEIAASESVVRETAVVRAEGVSRVFSAGGGEVWACRDISLTAAAGELVLVRGASGSGKTTLLNILGGLDAPSAGRVWIGDDELTAMSEQQLVNVRRTRLSYVFQSFGLIPILSAAENIEVPLRIQSMDAGERASRVAEALELVGLQDHALQRPYELSGGQQQRVAIARALAVRPEILIADEPTGQLDSGTAASVMDLIAQLVHERGLAAVISSHDPLLLERADRVIELHDGALLPAARSHGRRAAPPSEAAAEAEAAAALAAAEALSSQLP